MKKIFLLFVLLILAMQLTAADLVLIETENPTIAKGYFQQDALTVNYIHDDFLIATTEHRGAFDCELIATNCWERGDNYFLLWLDEGNNNDYILQIDRFADILLLKTEFMIIKVADEDRNKVVPIIHNGVVRINNIEAKLPKPSDYLRSSRFEEDPFVVELLGYVDLMELDNTVQTLEDFDTRNWYTQGSLDAQNWIFDKFDSYSLSVETQYIPYGGPNSSQNVIATLEGTLYPDQYVVLGCHYDSYSYYGDAPGADDNATGVAGILEIARILSQYEFNRTIIFCTFSGEEYGLHGSEEYATLADDADMDILGYFNIDMSGYLAPGEIIHTDMIAPASAAPLADFYEQVCAVYLPTFPIEPGQLTGGDSDHTSFNNHGFMGIFPFEDSENYSPFIHTPNDLNGTSVNNYEQVATFTKATMASVVTMANMLLPPENLTAIAGNEMITLSWDEVLEAEEYNIYRDEEEDPIATVTDLFYEDTGLINGQAYSYYVTAIYAGSGDESVPSNTVTAIPMPPISLPFADDFESGAPYWTFEGSWGLSENQSFSTTHSLTESPTGNYASNLDIVAGLISVDLVNYSDAEVSFWTKYAIENNYDYMYFEASTNGIDWDEYAMFTGLLSTWTQFTFSLNQYLGNSFVQLRFRFYSDTYVVQDGMYIDDFEINVENGVGSDDPIVKTETISNYPNPFNPSTTIMFNLTREITDDTEVTIYNLKGQKIKELIKEQLSSGEHSVVWNGTDDNGLSVSSGIYLYKVKTGNFEKTKKMILLK
ncbi:MAG: M28 family peptidase [Candidatus Cloacimonetes bacterium]|nr:M28 family peptidase [Candidatus Cloacimonadota bacterium]